MIRAPMLRVIDQEGNQLGVISLDQALGNAREAGLDLVEVAPLASPPVAKIMDYGKYKYQQEKKAKESKKKASTQTIKEIKLRPKIGQNDLDIKKRAIIEFLDDGCKVKLTLQFRGREMAYTENGKVMLEKLRDELAELAIADGDPRLEGRSMSLMFSPKKAKQPQLKQED